MPQQWIRIKCHGVNELLDVTAYRGFFIFNNGGYWSVRGSLTDGSFSDFPTSNPQRQEEAEALLEILTLAIQQPLTSVVKLQENLTNMEHG